MSNNNTITSNTLYSEPYDYLIKILIIGESGTGKSSLIESFIDGKFIEYPMLNYDMKQKFININENKVRVQLYDPMKSPQSRIYYKDAHGIIIVYDSTSKHSFYRLKPWLDEIDKNVNQNVNKLIIGNKCDLVEKKISLPQDQVLQLLSSISKNHEKTIQQVSSKNSINVEKSFINFISEIINRLDIEIKEKYDEKPQPICRDTQEVIIQNKKCIIQ